MPGDLVRDAAVEELGCAAQRACAHHDHRGVDLVGDLDDAFPRRARSTASSALMSSKSTAGSTGAYVAATGGQQQGDVEHDRAPWA
jgi:hypothetical protein